MNITLHLVVTILSYIHGSAPPNSHRFGSILPHDSEILTLNQPLLSTPRSFWPMCFSTWHHDKALRERLGLARAPICPIPRTPADQQHEAYFLSILVGTQHVLWSSNIVVRIDDMTVEALRFVVAFLDVLIEYFLEFGGICDHSTIKANVWLQWGVCGWLDVEIGERCFGSGVVQACVICIDKVARSWII